MASDIFLIWASGSAPCWRVMLALEEKGLSGYRNKLISFDKQEHKGEDVLRWNPRGQVPTFIHKDHAINESFAVCDYLEVVFKNQGTRLLPDDTVELGNVLQRKYEFFNLEKKGGEAVFYVFLRKPEEIDQKELKKRVEDFHTELKLWEKYLGQTEAYVAGKHMSMADVAFFPNLAFYVRLGLQLRKSYPNLVKYYDMMLKRPSVEKTWPPHWKGTEAPKKVFH